jgi:hypothetical protein
MPSPLPPFEPLHRGRRGNVGATQGNSGVEVHGEHRSDGLAEDFLDLAIELTFPASDPVSVDHAFKAASRSNRAKKRR